MISYSLYLVHVPVLRNGVKYLYGAPTGTAIGWSPPVVGLMTVLLAACVGLATLTYFGIERPFLVRKARLDR